jgi:hypothetical protein
MSRHLAFRRLRRSQIAMALAPVLLIIGSRLSAQDRAEHLDEGITPSTRAGRAALPNESLDEGVAPKGRAPRSSLSRPDYHMEPVDPEVEQLLYNWSEHTKRVKTLAGKHFRSIRNYTYGSEILAEGKFYVEMPDKGRFDVGNYSAPSPKLGAKKTYKAPNGTDTELTIQFEKNHEKWVCDGKVVKVINDTRRSYEEVPIPPKQQGANMIDGPLPFLLGMPPEKAKARYRFRLLDRVKDPSGDDSRWIEVKPRLPMDAAEWVRAYVLLNLRTYLPERVSLYNPDGTTETVYLFRDIDTSPRGVLQNIFGGDPFNPSVWMYRREVHNPVPRDPKSPAGVGPKMPLLVGAGSDDAKRIKKRLETLGFEVTFKKGRTAPTIDQVYHIESQQPEANTPLRPGQKIVLQYYDDLPRTVNDSPQQ